MSSSRVTTTNCPRCTGTLRRVTQTKGDFVVAYRSCIDCDYASEVLLSVDGVTGKQADGERGLRMKKILGTVFVNKKKD